MWTRFVVAFDVHGDKQDKKSNAALFRFLDSWKPKIRVFGGDLWDFRPLRKKATADEQRESMQKDFDAGMEWLGKFQPQFFIRGNHDERLWELSEKKDGIRSDAAIKDIAEIEKITTQMGCRMLPYHKRDGVLRLGHLKILHGFACGVYASRQTALVYGSVLFGHAHTIDEHAIPGLERRVARCCGCLCQLDMDYNARQPNSLRQAHGFAYGVINEKTGSYQVWQAEEIDGKWIIPTDTMQI